MARVEYQPFAQTEAAPTPPEDYQRINTTPEAFGVGVGQATENAGAGLQKLGEFYNQVAADNATNNTLQSVTNILYGDPSKSTTGPDGKPVQDSGFFGLRGANAMSARGDISAHIDEVIKENRENLSTPQAQYQYDVDTRRYRARWMQDIGQHADQQQRVWSTDTNNTAASLAFASAARDPGNDIAAAQAQEGARKALVRNAQLNGEDPQGALLKADQSVLLARVRSALVTNPPLAQKLFSDKGQILSSLPNYDEIGRAVKGAYIDSQIGPMVDGSIAQAQSDARGAVAGSQAAGRGFDSAWDFTLHHEGGYAPHDANGQPVKFGINQSAHPGVDIKNLTPDGAKAIARQYWDKSGAADLPAGMDALHFDTYYINPGEATKLLQESGGDPQKYLDLRKAWMNDLVAKDPEKFGRYEKAWDNRNRDLGTLISNAPQQSYPSVADYYRANYGNILDGVREKAEQTFGTQYPDAVDKSVSRAERQLNQTITQQNQQYEVDTHIVQGAMDGPHRPTSENDLMAAGPQVASAWQRMQVENPLGANGVRNMFDANAKGKSVSYGANFSRFLDRALAPVGDPSRITNPSQLWPYVTGGEGGALTNSGAAAVSDLMAFRSGKDNEAPAGQLRSLLKQVRGDLSFSNEASGVRDEHGDKLYETFARQALPLFMQASPADRQNLLDPKNKDSLPAMAGSLARSPAGRLKDFLHDVPETGAGHALLTTFQTLHGTEDRKKALRDAVSSGTISREEGTRIGIEMGYIGSQANTAKPPPQKAVSSGPDVPLPEEVRP